MDGVLPPNEPRGRGSGHRNAYYRNYPALGWIDIFAIAKETKENDLILQAETIKLSLTPDLCKSKKNSLI